MKLKASTAAGSYSKISFLSFLAIWTQICNASPNRSSSILSKDLLQSSIISTGSTATEVPKPVLNQLFVHGTPNPTTPINPQSQRIKRNSKQVMSDINSCLYSMAFNMEALQKCLALLDQQPNNNIPFAEDFEDDCEHYNDCDAISLVKGKNPEHLQESAVLESTKGHDSESGYESAVDPPLPLQKHNMNKKSRYPSPALIQKTLRSRVQPDPRRFRSLFSRTLFRA